jgi:beta-N-acetylhexosaminidase
MRNIERPAFTVGLVILLFVGCGNLSAQNLDSLSLKIGQMILIGFPGERVDTLVLEEIRAGKVGSIIMFEKNVPGSAASLAAQKKNIPWSSASFTSLKKILWTYQQAAAIPLLVTIDQEGGKVNRLKPKYGFSKSITAQEMGNSHSLDSVRFYAESTAATLAGLGINVNFAPVVDLGVNKENTVIYKVGRSFSANPDSVALLADEFIKPHRRFGVITALKHFPGHGSSTADTHVGIADVTHTWTAAELVPYERLIAHGSVDAIMSAHIVNRKLDPSGLPGTLSKRMLDSLLRKQMHYDGVIFSDDMQMQAIAREYGLEEAIRLSINAGIDILCFSNNIQGSEERTVDKVHGIIRSLVEKGQIPSERIDLSFRRIMKLKERIKLPGSEVMQKQMAVKRESGIPMDSTAVKQEVPSNENASTTKKEKKQKRKKKKSE